MNALDRKARRARTRLVGAGVLAGVVLVGAGVLVGTALDDGEGASAPAQRSRATSSPGGPEVDPVPVRERTPATARRVPVLTPRTTKHGIGVGFEHSGLGAVSAAVSYQEELDFLDDVTLRKQLATIISKDSPDSIDRRVSDVRKLREAAGLPPSGGVPNGLTFTKEVKAARDLSLTKTGDVVEVWMNYDVYATSPKKPVDQDPLKDETTYMIVKWEDGDWKITEEPQYLKRRTFPRAYHPDSPYAYQDRWREIA